MKKSIFAFVLIFFIINIYGFCVDIYKISCSNKESNVTYKMVVTVDESEEYMSVRFVEE